MSNHKTHIVHFHNGLGGGVLSVIRNLLAHSKNDNIVNHIIFTIEKKQFLNFIPPEIKGAASIQLFYYVQENNFYYTCKQLAKLLPGDNAIIVAHDWLELGMASNLGLPNPVVQIIHGDYDYYYELAKKHAHIIDHFITVADSIEKKLQKIIPERTQDIKYLRFPVPDNNWANKKPQDFSIIFIGRGTKEKGYPVLPGIAKALMAEEHKLSWHIVGEMNENLQHLYPWPAKTTIHFYGDLPNVEVQKLLGSMHVILLPSMAEGMPIAVIEAMKAVVIPLVNDIPGGIQELIANGITGFKIEENSIDMYKGKIIYLLNNSQEREEMQVNAKGYADKYFNPIENTLAYEKAFMESNKTIREKKKKKAYGSRLDQFWLPNFISKTFRV